MAYDAARALLVETRKGALLEGAAHIRLTTGAEQRVSASFARAVGAVNSAADDLCHMAEAPCHYDRIRDRLGGTSGHAEHEAGGGEGIRDDPD